MVSRKGDYDEVTSSGQPTVPHEVSKKLLQNFKPQSATSKRIPLDTATALSGAFIQSITSVDF